MEIIFERIKMDKIPIYKVRGVVRGLWLGQWNSGPADFMIETDTGERFNASCELEIKEACIKYTLGRVRNRILQSNFKAARKTK